MSRRAIPLLSLLLLAAVAAAAESTCFAGDIRRSAVATDAQVPVGGRVLWKAPIANWGWGQPVVMRGRVFVTYEPGYKADFPHLVCYDAQSGKELWDRELDHLDKAVGAGKAKALREDWHKLWYKVRGAFQLMNTHYLTTSREESEAILNRHGFKVAKWYQKNDEPMRGMQHEDSTKDRVQRCRAAGLELDTYIRNGCALQVIGHAFPAPCADGERVYVTTAWGGSFAFDHDGKPLWVAWVNPPGGTDTFPRSPLLYGDLFISDTGNLVRAVERTSGRIRWQHPYQRGSTITSPAVLTIDGTDVLIGEGMNAFRLPDGAPLTVAGWQDTGTHIVVKHDEPDVAFFIGGGEHGAWSGKGKGSETPPPAAVRFALAGDTLTGTVLWSGVEHGGSRHPVCDYLGMVYDDGRLFLSAAKGMILDAGTGRVLAGSPDKGGGEPVPPSQLSLWATRDHLIGCEQVGSSRDKSKPFTGRVVVHDRSGKPVASWDIPQAPEDEAKLEKMSCQTFVKVGRHSREGWRFSYSCPFVPAGNRLYVRSADELVCIGR